MRWQEVDRTLAEAEACPPPRDFTGPKAVGWLQGREDTLLLIREVLDLPPASLQVEQAEDVTDAELPPAA